MLDYAIIFLNSLKHFTHTEFTALELVFLVIYILVVKGLETQKSGFFFRWKPIVVDEDSNILCFALGRPAEGAWVREQTPFPDLYWNCWQYKSKKREVNFNLELFWNQRIHEWK